MFAKIALSLVSFKDFSGKLVTCKFFLSLWHFYLCLSEDSVGRKGYCYDHEDNKDIVLIINIKYFNQLYLASIFLISIIYLVTYLVFLLSVKNIWNFFFGGVIPKSFISIFIPENWIYIRGQTVKLDFILWWYCVFGW